MILVISVSGSCKTNMLLNLTKHQKPNTDTINFYIKDPFESRYHLLINGTEKLLSKKFKNRKVFIDYLQTIDDVYKNNDPKDNKSG